MPIIYFAFFYTYSCLKVVLAEVSRIGILKYKTAYSFNKSLFIGRNHNRNSHLNLKSYNLAIKLEKQYNFMLYMYRIFNFLINKIFLFHKMHLM